MKYLLDTHIVLWWLLEPEKINQKTREIIGDKENDIFVSSVSFWELGIKSALGRFTIPRNIIEVLVNEGFKMLPIAPEEALGVMDLPPLHQDPFDRLLIVQAKFNDLVLITKDKKILNYPLAVLEI